MNEFDINRYIDISNFLSTLLGPDYEIILYDMNHILYMVNCEISGGKVGDKISPTMKTVLNKKKSFDEKWISNYRALSGNGKILRCSTFYIRDDDNNLVGAMNINFDDNRYKELSKLVFSLCHPDKYVNKNISIEIKGNSEQELFSDSISNAVDEILHRIDSNLTFSKLSHVDKLDIIKQLYQKGIFSMKGAIKTVGHRLSCSPASMYRYLDIVKNENKV